MTVRAVFFDMDDTLLDTSGGVGPAWEAACSEVADELGVEWTTLRDAIVRQMTEFWKDEAAVEHWRTRLVAAREQVISRTLQAEGWDSSVMQRISDRYGEERERRLELFDDAIETLEVLRGKGYRLGLLTNGPADMQRSKVDRFGLERHFDVVVIEGEFGRGKPHPEVFAHALSTVGFDPAEAWHVGDNLYADIGGAQNAGLHATWIHRDRLELNEPGMPVPDRVIAHLGELREALGC